MEVAVPALIDRFLNAPSRRTTQAYAIDLADFARWRDCSRQEAVCQLLTGGAENARHLVLRYAAHLKGQGRAVATIERRLGTLRALVRLAEREELIDWWLDVRDWRSQSENIEEDLGKDVAYVLPRHPAERDRLDLQHYALAEALGRVHYLAPVSSPRRVLDVGAGTGQWGYDISAAHLDALVVGLDLVQPKSGAPARYRAVRGNVLQGLPFRSGSFDFVHQRLLFSGVPVAAWPEEVAELARVCSPGGWVELVEGTTWFDKPGPATRRLAELLLEVNRRAGLDTESAISARLHEYLLEAGLDEVQRQWVELPMGEWAGKVGSLMASDFRALFTRMSWAFTTALGVPAAESMELVRAAQMEWEELHTTYAVVIAWGRKPSGRAEE